MSNYEALKAAAEEYKKQKNPGNANQLLVLLQQDGTTARDIKLLVASFKEHMIDLYNYQQKTSPNNHNNFVLKWGRAAIAEGSYRFEGSRNMHSNSSRIEEFFNQYHNKQKTDGYLYTQRNVKKLGKDEYYDSTYRNKDDGIELVLQQEYLTQVLCEKKAKFFTFVKEGKNGDTGDMTHCYSNEAYLILRGFISAGNELARKCVDEAAAMKVLREAFNSEFYDLLRYFEFPKSLGKDVDAIFDILGRRNHNDVADHYCNYAKVGGASAAAVPVDLSENSDGAESKEEPRSNYGQPGGAEMFSPERDRPSGGTPEPRNGQ